MGDFLSDNPLVLLIGACEVGFWVLPAAGLATRYLLRAQRLSTVLLLLVPVLDVVLVSAALVDVAGGSPPGLTHGLAAVYLGTTVAFGHTLIRWADAWFVHRFAGGPRPPRPPRYGAAKVAYEWREWGKAALAWGIALGVMLLTATVAGTGVPRPFDWFSDPMWNWSGRFTVVLLIWLIGWPPWTTLIVPSATVLFLAGALLLRAGALTDTPAGMRIRRRLMIVGFGVALPLNALTAFGKADWFLVDRYLLPPVVAVGLLALVTTAVVRSRRAPGPVRNGLAAVGRTALSCSVAQNLLGAFLCYGWGLGLAVRFVDAPSWWAVGLWATVCAVLVVAASLWLRWFDRGPLELLAHRVQGRGRAPARSGSG